MEEYPEYIPYLDEVRKDIDQALEDGLITEEDHRLRIQSYVRGFLHRLLIDEEE